MRMHFATSRSQLPALDGEDVGIWPVDPGWNDFGYGYQAAGVLRSSERGEFTFRLFVVPWRKGDPASRFNVWLAEVSNGAHCIEVRPDEDAFFSILRGDGYRALADWCAGDGALRDRFLDRLRDIVKIRVRGEHSEELDAFLRSEAAAIGVFRDATTYLALHRGWRHFIERESAPVEDAMQDFSFSCLLADFSGPHKLQISNQVSDGLPSRCHALIGRNGAGKSRFLREIVFALANKSGISSTAFNGGNGSTSTGGQLTTEGGGFNRVVTMAWDQHHGYPVLLPLTEPFEYQFYSMLESVSGDSTPASVESLTAMTIQILRDRGGEGMGDRLAVLRESLRDILDLGEIGLLVPESGWHSLESIWYRGEQARLEMLASVDLNTAPMSVREGDVRPFSSGQRTFFAFAVRLAAAVEVGTLLLLDEPETHLHPNMIVAFMKMLHQGLEKAKSIAVVSTHSLFVARELPSSCVHVIEVDQNGRPEMKRPYLRTLGASVDRLAMDIFGDAEQRAYYKKIASEIASKFESIEEVIAKLGPEISFEMLTLVREEMKEDKNARN